MKKANLLSKAELKEVMGGVPLASYCGEGMLFVHCDIEIPLPGGAYSHGMFEGCMTQSNYDAEVLNGQRCRIIGEGGPYPID